MESVQDRSPGKVYALVTAEIIRAIEAGIADQYQMPWHRNASQGFPMNAFTGRHYHGLNTLALWAACQLKGYPTSWWATYRQWNEIGAHVRRGEKASPVLFYKEIQSETEGDADVSSPDRQRVVVRLSHVFNADQVDGWQVPGLPAIDRTDSIERVDHFIAAVGARIQYGGDSAYYSRRTDHIQMPKRSSFIGTETSTPTESFYSVLLHEHVHWSGHPARLNRDLSGRFGDSAYAMEELVAELGAAFLCAELNISDVPRKDHALYVRSWLPVLKEKQAALAIASSAATKACRYLGELSGAAQQTA
jgi:antirestriction protein ArdC